MPTTAARLFGRVTGYRQRTLFAAAYCSALGCDPAAVALAELAADGLGGEDAENAADRLSVLTLLGICIARKRVQAASVLLSDLIPPRGMTADPSWRTSTVASL